ncbi:MULTISPECIES: Ig-like domain-containing protein [Citrobacter]|uniref:Ig-like domain-containing protein n=1 Tax=Citrobacter sp. Cb007 TaxID=2985008 RepID=UPI002A372373|nr:Ig-like domain-containing protein [Citrobacter braakii]
MSVMPETSSGDVGTSVTLTANLAPAGATDAVQWESSDPTLATVVSTGPKTCQVVRAGAGTATITGKVRGFTATAEITVTQP